MTFLSVINWLPIIINLLLLVFVIVCLLLILVVLMQRPKQEGLGAAFGGGVTDQVFGARTTNVLQRGTVYLGSLFFIISLLLAVLIGQKNKVISTVKSSDTAPKVEVKPVTPPAETKPKSLSEELPPENAPVQDATPTPAEVPADAATPVTPPVETPAPPADGATPPPAAPEATPPPAEAPAQPEGTEGNSVPVEKKPGE